MRVERIVGFPPRIERVTTKISKCNTIQIGEAIENGVIRFKEVFIKGHTYFEHNMMSYDKEGKRIEGSRFHQKIEGEEAKDKQIGHFGVWG